MRSKYTPPQHKIIVIVPPGLYCYNPKSKHRCKFLSTFADVDASMMEYHCTYYNVLWICLNGVPIKHNKCVGYFDYGTSTYEYKFHTELMKQEHMNPTGLDKTITELAIVKAERDALKTQLNR